MPEVTSGVVGVLQEASSPRDGLDRALESSKAASVLVPPTSMPMRYILNSVKQRLREWRAVRATKESIYTLIFGEISSELCLESRRRSSPTLGTHSESEVEDSSAIGVKLGRMLCHVRIGESSPRIYLSCSSANLGSERNAPAVDCWLSYAFSLKGTASADLKQRVCLHMHLQFSVYVNIGTLTGAHCKILFWGPYCYYICPHSFYVATKALKILGLLQYLSPSHSKVLYMYMYILVRHLT